MKTFSSLQALVVTMSLRTPIILTAGCLFVLWLYFTIRQFWTTLQIVSSPPLMTAYNGNSEDIHTSHQISEPKMDIHRTKSPSFSPTIHLDEAIDNAKKAGEVAPTDRLKAMVDNFIGILELSL